MVVQNSSSSKNASSSTAISKPNKTTTTIIVTGAKASTAKASSAAPSYNKTGFSNLNILTINGKNFPIKYSIKGGKLGANSKDNRFMEIIGTKMIS
jgi:hypothetical protein